MSKNFWFRVGGECEGARADGFPFVPAEGLPDDAGLAFPLASRPPLSDGGVPFPDVPGLRERGDFDRSDAGRRYEDGDAGDAGDAGDRTSPREASPEAKMDLRRFKRCVKAFCGGKKVGK